MPVLAHQDVSGCCGLMCFKPADNGCSWFLSGCVAAVAWCVSSLLTTPVLGSPESEWLLWLGASSLLTMAVLGVPACECLLWFGVFQAC